MQFTIDDKDATHYRVRVVLNNSGKPFTGVWVPADELEDYLERLALEEGAATFELGVNPDDTPTFQRPIQGATRYVMVSVPYENIHYILIEGGVFE